MTPDVNLFRYFLNHVSTKDLSVSIFIPNLVFKKIGVVFLFWRFFLLPPLVCGLRADLVLQIKNSWTCALMPYARIGIPFDVFDPHPGLRGPDARTARIHACARGGDFPRC